MDHNAQDCCGPAADVASCRGPESENCCAPASSSSRGKLVVSVLIVGAAVVVLARGLMKPTDEGVVEAATPAALNQDAGVEAGDDAPPGARLAKEATGQPPILDAYPALKQQAGENEVIFVLLPGDDEDGVKAVLRQVRAAEMTVLSRARLAGTITVEKDTGEHGRLVKQFAVTSYPSVIAIGRGCCAKLVAGDITEKKLLAAFVIASAPPSSCAGEASCCPAGGK